MKIPETAPTLKQLIEEGVVIENAIAYGTPYDLDGHYCHWEEMKRRVPPGG